MSPFSGNHYIYIIWGELFSIQLFRPPTHSDVNLGTLDICAIIFKLVIIFIFAREFCRPGELSPKSPYGVENSIVSQLSAYVLIEWVWTLHIAHMFHSN